MRPISCAAISCLVLSLTTTSPARAWFGEDLWNAGKSIVEGGADLVVGAGEAIGGFFSSDYESHDIFCRRYAAQAVAQVQKANDNSCGFVNAGRFVGNQSAHLTWCLREAGAGNQDFVNNEAAARNRAVANCQSCKSVADRARAQAKENIMFHCGGTGPMWSTDFTEQLRRCIGPDGVFASTLYGPSFAARPARQRLASAVSASKEKIKLAMGKHLSIDEPSEGERRQDMLDQCKGRHNPEDIVNCRAFAERAVKNATIWQSRQCGPDEPPGRFSTDFVHHMAWCMWKDNAQFREGEDKARIQAVEGCKQTHPVKDCKSCHSSSAKATSSGGVSLAGISQEDHSLFSNISAAVQAVLSTGGAYTSKSPSAVAPLKKKTGAGAAAAIPRDPGSGGAYQSRGVPGGSSAMDRLGGGGSKTSVPSSSGGFDRSSGRLAPTPGSASSGGGASPGAVTTPSKPSINDQIIRLDRQIVRPPDLTPKWKPGDPK